MFFSSTFYIFTVLTALVALSDLQLTFGRSGNHKFSPHTVHPSSSSSSFSFSFSSRTSTSSHSEEFSHRSGDVTATSQRSGDVTATSTSTSNSNTWSQWGQNAAHAGFINVTGQRPERIIYSIQYDHVRTDEINLGNYLYGAPTLLSHYQTPLSDHDNYMYMMYKTGSYPDVTSLGCPGDILQCTVPNPYRTEVWGQYGFEWVAGAPVLKWQFNSSWVAVASPYNMWEPLFHVALYNNYVLVPGGCGNLTVVNKFTGAKLKNITPFHNLHDSVTCGYFIVSPITVFGNSVFYTVLQMPPDDGTIGDSTANFAFNDAIESYLIRVTDPDLSSAHVNVMTFSSIFAQAARSSISTIGEAPLPANAQCETSYPFESPSLNDTFPPNCGGLGVCTASEYCNTPPATTACGTQRVAINPAPAVSLDGSVVYLLSRAHFAERYGYIIAVSVANQSSLKPLWIRSTRNTITYDGCQDGLNPYSVMPVSGQPGGCAACAAPGLDPSTNSRPQPMIDDSSSSSPVIAPDGSIILGTLQYYNYAQGHLLHFSSTGDYLNSYTFGWDTTPAAFGTAHDYTIVTKVNFYNVDTYSYVPVNRSVAPSYKGKPSKEGYWVTAFDKNLHIKWQYASQNHQVCERESNGSFNPATDCYYDWDTFPAGFEWCVNMDVVDKDGVVYANSEDGFLYRIKDGVMLERILQDRNFGAAYTPAALDSQGRILSQNYGILYVIGH